MTIGNMVLIIFSVGFACSLIYGIDHLFSRIQPREKISEWKEEIK